MIVMDLFTSFPLLHNPAQ